MANVHIGFTIHGSVLIDEERFNTYRDIESRLHAEWEWALDNIYVDVDGQNEDLWYELSDVEILDIY